VIAVAERLGATPAVEKALAWVRSLGEREFVGTESRLNTVFELLRQIVHGTEADPAARIEELTRRRQEIDDEIGRVLAGEVPLLDRSAVRDRYQQLTATAWELLSDFRQVEENFRRLDRQLREKIAGWQGGKGELLDDVLGSRESIAGSDQGRSFQAFYDFLLSQARQEELAGLLDRVNELSDLAERDPRLRRVHYDWLDAAGRTQTVVAQLSEQLRRFLDDQAWFENRRVIDILREIEGSALRLRDAPPTGLTIEIDAAAPVLSLPFERPLYAPVRKPRLDSQDIRAAGSDEETDPTALFEQAHVDPGPLRDAVRAALRRSTQATLAEIVTAVPLRQGGSRSGSCRPRSATTWTSSACKSSSTRPRATRTCASVPPMTRRPGSCPGWFRAGHCRSTSACCWRCCARSSPSLTPRAATPG
jgi:flagellar motility protein MotE (MotC chaperone)